MTEIGGATFVFDARVEGVKRGLALVKSEFREVQKEADRVSQRTSAAARTMGSAMSAMISAGGDPSKVAGAWSKATGMLAEDMDRVAQQAKASGVTFAEMTQRLMHFKEESWRAKRGTGELYNVLKQYDGEMAVAMRLTTTNAGRQAVLNAALDRAKDSTVRARIEAAAFGTEMEKTGKSAGIFGNAIGSAGKMLAGYLTIAAGMTAIRSIGAAIKDVADIGDLAANIGMTTDQLQEFQYAFAQTGLTADKSAGGLQRFAEKLSEARAGEGELAEIFKANNVALTDREGHARSTAEMLGVYADMIRNAKTAEDALNLSVKAFGKEAGRDFIEALRNGSDGLDDMAKAAQDAGTIITASQIAAADRIETKYNAMLENVSRGWHKFVVSVAEDTASMTDALMNGDFATFLFGERGTPLRRLNDYLTGDPVNGSGKGDLQGSIPSGAPSAPSGSGTTVIPSKSDGTAAKVLESLRQEAELLKLSNVERAAREALIRSGLSAESAMGKTIMAQARANELVRISQEEAKKASEEAQRQKEAERKEIENYIESLDEQLKALQLEVETYGLSNAAKARAAAMSGLSANATDAERKEAEKLADAIAAVTQEIEDKQDADEAALAHFKNAAAEMQKAYEAQKDAFDFLKDQTSDLFFSMIDGTESASEAFKKLAANIIKEILNAVVFGEGSFAKLFEQMGGGSDGLFGSLFGDLFSGLFRATGGRVSAGQTYNVGEEGTEKFVPDDPTKPAIMLSKGRFTPSESGEIVPNEIVGRGVVAVSGRASQVQNILATAARPAMDSQVPAYGANDNAGSSFTFAPTIQVDNFSGDKNDLSKLLQEQQTQFEKRMEAKLPQMLRDGRRKARI